MDSPLTEQLTAAATRLATAAEALETALARLDAQHQELNSKVERIVAAIDEASIQAVAPPFRPVLAEGGEVADPAVLQARVAELERNNADLKAQAARAGRKTLSPLVTAILAKNEVADGADTAALDKALASLSVEQRMAVKAEMARAGMIE